MKRLLSFVLTAILLFSALPSELLSVRGEGNATAFTSEENPFEGKTISILGASISTFAGTSNGEAASTTNSTIENNAKYYPHATVSDVGLQDTWWMQAANDLGLRLLVNNSWSGSSLLHTRNGTVGAYVDRCVQLHDDTGENAGETPDIIAIQMGTNDYQYYKDTLGNSDIDYDTLITQNTDGTYTYALPKTSLEAAAIVLHKISVRYPEAEVYYLNLSKRLDITEETEGVLEQFNADLAVVCEHFDAHIVDIYGSAITTEVFDIFIGDGRVHPNCLGMDAYTEAFKQSVLQHSAYTATAHTVTFDLTDATVDYGTDKLVLSGKAFSAELFATVGNSLQVSVTMGGKDITDTAYTDGTVSIGQVTADVTVTAKGIHLSQNYRWEFDGTDLADTIGNNPLTKIAGTTSDGVFSATEYALQSAIVLRHDHPWFVEWKCEGTWKNTATSSGGRLFTTTAKNAEYNARYIFKSATNWLIAMGEKTTTGSHNYGIALADHGIDGSALHTYRLQNRIHADGSNMVYLYVDGKEIGAMEHYYIGTKYQNTTSDWLSGKDFTLPFIGTDTHGLNNCKIEYIAVSENGNPFEGKTISILGDSISTFEGVSNDATVNATLQGGAVYYTPGRWDVYREDTWWQQAADALGMEVLVNNSWSGSSVLHTRRGTVGAYVDRCVQLHNDKTGETPDVIVVYMGGNDFNYYQDTLGDADIDYGTLISQNEDGTFSYATPVTTCEAYAIVLHKMSVRYPDAQIVCMGSTPRRDPDKEDDYPDLGQPTAFNAARKQIAEHFGCAVVDIEHCGISKDAEIFDQYIGDGRTHPNAEGMDLIAQALVSVLLGRDSTLLDVTYELDGATVDQRATVALQGNDFSVKVTPKEGYQNLRVTVTVDGEDVTESSCSDGMVTVRRASGDINITATAVREPMHFRWDMTDGRLISTGETENRMTALAGSVTDGVITDGRFGTELPVILRHDRPWVLEWRCAQDWRGVVLSEDPPRLEENRYYLSRTKGGQLCFGAWNGKQYNNYGVDLSGLDAGTHTFRMENRIAKDGGNMIELYVDGVLAGEMNNYFIGSKSQNTTSDWVSGKDFAFSYIGTVSTPLTNCALEFVQVWESIKTVSLSYDDRYDVTGKTVEILDAGKPTSYKVGYGVAEQTPDDAVITLQGETLIATGIGNARVRIDGTIRQITVKAAPISLLLLIGQSNMRGSEGNANQSIVCPDGMVYSTYGDDRGADNVAMTEENATRFAPSALTGEYSSINVEGTADCLSGYPVYSLTQAGVGKIGPDSGFAYEWVKQTGEKVWIVNAAHGGSSITTWQKTGANYLEALALFSACQETLGQEIAAGHYTLSHMGYFWCQGCTDYAKTADWYVDKYLTMHENFKADLAFDHDGNAETEAIVFEFGGIIPVRAGHEKYTSYRQGVYTDTTTKKYHESFMDLRFTGPRVAQYWMINNPELTDIWGVCNIGESWVWMPDGTNGVADYFNKHYTNGTVDYQTQVEQKASWYTPTTPAAVHDSIHYNQIGYNEVGRESVRNALIQLGELDAPETETTVRFLTWDGYTEAKEIAASVSGNSNTLVVPVVYPIYDSKKVTCEISEGLTWSYYDLLAESPQSTGTVTSLGESVTVVKSAPGSHFAEHLRQLPQQICSGLNLWTLLEHDEYYFASGTGWGKYSTGEVRSVTIPINPGDRIYATSLGAYGTNGHSSTSGIRTTFFSDYGVAKTMAPAEVYAEFVANGGYIVAPEGATAVNVAMWNDSDSNELYILNMPHAETDNICTICGSQEHTHSFTTWETVSEPDCNGPGKELRTCTGCGETETRTVNSVWQTTDLAQYIQALPETFCGASNLWSVLRHDPVYYIVSQGSWGYHSSKNVPSVTIPVQSGDKVFATSFGKAGVNGHASANGIRVTWFDINGVLKTTDPSGTYAEFSANGGYLIAPEGAIAVNIPLWNNSDENEIYLLDKEHIYTNAICTACGAEHPNLTNYQGKVISILGDSISTFAGYIPTADGFNLEHLARYPQDNLLTDVNETWWMQVIHALNAKLGINDSWRGATASGAVPVTTGTTGENAAFGNLTRVQNLGSNGTPDVILFYGGTNDLAHVSAIGSFDAANAPTVADLTAKSWDNLADGYVQTLLRLKHFYPNATVIAILPAVTASYYSDEKLIRANAVLTQICEHYGIPFVDLQKSRLKASHLPDGIHPGEEGMDIITELVCKALLEQNEISAGEHIVYTVTHRLRNATVSKPHFKGISAGTVFEETVKGDQLAVTVTMGGVDITSQVYADGRILIEHVTGDLVIAVSGTFDADGHLQALPEKLCQGTNLWAVLAHDREYYTVNGWGVHGSGSVYSVTFCVSEGDRLFATSFGKAGQNGQSSVDGIRVTYFDDSGVLKTMSSSETYAEFSANGYLTAPEGAIAVSIPMWNNSDENEIYLLDKEHTYIATVTAPQPNAKGYTTHTCTECGDSYVDDYTDFWEVGTIAAANGTDTANSTRLRVSTYLQLSEYSGVTVGRGYTLTYFVYDQNKTYLGNGTTSLTGNWLGSGVPIKTETMQALYPGGVYFRIALRAIDSGTLTVDDVSEAKVAFYSAEEELPTVQSDLKYEDIANIGSWQDGAIFDNKLFVFNANGSGAVYDLASMTKLSALTLGQKDIILPHANSVCFGNTFYSAADKYPLLYINVYNNYSNAESRMEGTCCVYRVTEAEGTYSLELVQVIGIGFTEDLTLWKSKENNGDVRPYGNFVVDVDHDKLYAFVMRDKDKTTRFFCFDLPALTDGTDSELYGCPVVTLEASDIQSYFDTAYFNYLQGCCYFDGKLVSVEGFGAGTSAEPALRLIDLASQKLINTYYLAEASLTKEPEVICADPLTGMLYYAAADGILRILTMPEWHAHAYVSTVTEPTCTEQGYTTHTCSECGNTYTDSVTSAKGHSMGDWHEITAPTCTENGTEQRDCANCDYTETQKINAPGHDYVKGKCTACGERNFLYGDANGDGTVDGKDTTRLLNYLLLLNPHTGESTVEIAYGADADGDGTVNGRDVMRMLRYFAFFDPGTGDSAVILGPQS